MKSLILLALVLTVAFAKLDQNEVKRKFIAFQQKYDKVYSSDQFHYRFQVFADNLERAAEFQAQNPQAQFGATIFSDLTPAEFKQMYLMNFDKEQYELIRPAAKTEFGPSVTQGSTFDWGSKGAVTAVYNQGQCGSCWAFSATETIESYFFLAGNSLTQLSMQQIVSCDTGGSDQGCEGGFPSDAYNYVQSEGGIDSGSSYPYTSEGGSDGTCQFSKSNVVTTVASQQSIADESGLYQQLSSGGPVSVCVDASSWQSYEGGVLTSCGNSVDHCVQATGFINYAAQYNGESAWNVRNSWGASWGMNGYIQIATGQDLCSIGDYATIVST
jgi:cathepsin F/cysteine peptidase B